MSSASHWFDQAYRHFAEGSWQDCLRACQQAVDLEPQDARSWRLLGQVHLELDRLDAAQHALERCLALVPSDLGTQTILAFVLNRRGNPRQAIELCQSVIDRAPQFVSAWLVMGHSHEMLDDLKRAQAAFQQ